MQKRSIRWSQHRLFKTFLILGFFTGALFLTKVGVGLFQTLNNPLSAAFLSWGVGNRATREALVISQQEPCSGSPFILPADGFIGLLYADPRGPYSRSNPHQGIDIFSADRDIPGSVPVYAAYDGYVTREKSWHSTLIQRVPSDPLNPDTQVWLYYTHMADQDGDDVISDRFPPGTQELFVEQGTLLGYTGNYNGNSPRSIWVHLHFSIVMDDGQGHYANELEFENSIDPSPYLGIPVNHNCSSGMQSCMPNPSCG